MASGRIPTFSMSLYMMRDGLVGSDIIYTRRHASDKVRFGSSAGRANSAKLVAASYEHTLLLTIIMSNERSSDQSRIRKIAGSFKEKLSSLLHLSQAPTPSSIDMDSSTDNSTK